MREKICFYSALNTSRQRNISNMISLFSIVRFSFCPSHDTSIRVEKHTRWCYRVEEKYKFTSGPNSLVDVLDLNGKEKKIFEFTSMRLRNKLNGLFVDQQLESKISHTWSAYPKLGSIMPSVECTENANRMKSNTLLAMVRLLVLLVVAGRKTLHLNNNSRFVRTKLFRARMLTINKP